MTDTTLYDNFSEGSSKSPKQVTCLGMTFENEEDRRNYFTEKLREKLQDPEFRKIEGFPIGSNEDILHLSDPPYYTACPNPWIADFIKEWESEKPDKPADFKYHREPFAADVSEGKNDPIYNAHSYHTKVPYRAIQHYIQHFTVPGDIVADTFCGTGMTALAASSLNRKSIVADLSPYATFIAYNYCHPIKDIDLKKTWEEVLERTNQEIGWVYVSEDESQSGILQYAVWSDHYFCPNCSEEIIFWEILVDESEQFKSELKCPHCLVLIEKSALTKVRSADGEVKRSIVKIYESRNGHKNSRKPNFNDELLIRRCLDVIKNTEVPTELMMFKGDRFGDMYVPRQHSGLTQVNHFYLPRSLLVASTLYKNIKSISNVEVRNYLIWAFLSVQNYINKKQSYFGGGGGQPGTLTIADIIQEKNALEVINRKVRKLITLLPDIINLISSDKRCVISTQTATVRSFIPNASVDYIFMDPPFGRNLMYSELNFINESWLRVFTQYSFEAIVNKSQGKGEAEYRQLMTLSFQEAYRILKPGHWITVEFSNTKASIWNSIQAALAEAGFIVANVSALDKKQGTFKAVTTPTAVKQDLVISAYRPNGGFEERFQKEAQTEAGVWDFVRTHLEYLPVTKYQGALLQLIPERDPRILFDQMVAYYVRKGYPVPISSQEFQIGLGQRFIERDGMYFLPEQAAEYDRKKLTSGQLIQTKLFVSDEASAIQWLRQLLKAKPQTFQDINPQFMQELGGWSKNEQQLDLRELLNQNFLSYNSIGDVPSQIHGYLSTNWPEMRNLQKDDPALMAKAKDRWYVPDPNKAGDLEKLRERSLLKEFDEYKQSTKKLKVFRMEAVRTGFKKAWQERDYSTIIKVADLIPNSVLEEDPKLLMWYDQAVTRVGGE
ncbi:MAG: DNA methyltransferase [Methanomethylovorans sp.]|uniref:DNA methyltransferase n=1 Tax=Methanomethylovorans sp. TaxID=2758717 RepID=UPI003530DAEC